MNKRPIRLGDLLIEMGRITPDDVECALDHQRVHGGYLGDALIRLGLLTHDELRWSLADQHDIPFVHLRPENIDHALAGQVPAAWAREHLVLPVLRNGGTVTAVLEDLSGLEKLEEVRRYTRAERVEPALSTPERIRELIQAVHGQGGGPPVGLGRLVEEALERGASELGVSVRPGRVEGWYRAGEKVRRALDAGWEAELEEVVSPLSPLPTSPVHTLRQWPAILTAGGSTWRVECHALGRGESLEWAARLLQPVRVDLSRVEVCPELAAAVRRAREAGSVVARVHPADYRLNGSAAPLETLEAALPALPALLLDDPRALHLSSRPVAAPRGALYLLLREPLEMLLPRLEPFALEALTLDVGGLRADDVDTLRRVSPFVAALARLDGRPGPLPADLHLSLRADGERLIWTQLF